MVDDNVLKLSIEITYDTYLTNADRAEEAERVREALDQWAEEDASASIVHIEVLEV